MGLIIYKVTNIINQKIYIGQTCRDIQVRWKRHISDAEHNVLDTHFARAIRQFGKENFIVEVIDKADTQEELNEKEVYWIKYFDSVNNGYNETDSKYRCGGNTYKSKSKDEMKIICEKIRLSKIGGSNPNSTKIKCVDILENKTYYFNAMSEAVKYFGFRNHTCIHRRCAGIIKKPYLDRYLFYYN